MTSTDRRPRALARLFVAVGATMTLLLAAGSIPAQAIGTVHASISGSGSTWSANALEQWNRNVFSNYQWRVQYASEGSTVGRQAFRDGTTDFGVTEIPYELRDSDAIDPRPTRGFAYMPIVAGGTAFMYNLVIGGKKVTNLRLSGENVTKIFTNAITMWNDPALQADNPGLQLPAIPIVPVVRSDGSGTSAQLTTWMRKQYPGLWNDYCVAVGRGANCGITSNYPYVQGSRFVARSGSNSVAGYVAQSHAVGAITYVEYSYALNARFPVAKILNSGGYYTEPTAQNVAVGLLGARINEDATSPDFLTQDLTGVYTGTDTRTYPLSSYSYMIIPTKLESGFTEDKGLTLADYAAYFLCEGQQQAEVLGYSPLPINLVTAGQNQIKKIPGGNPTIEGIAACNNPTFSPDGSNKLANTAPFPAECDKQGTVQCASGTGGSKDTPTDTSGGGGGGAGGGAAGGGGGAGGGGTAGAADTATGAAGDTGAVVGAEAGLADGLSEHTADLIVNAEPTSVALNSSMPLVTLLGMAAGILLVGGASIPLLVVRRKRLRAASAVGGPFGLGVRR